MRFQDMLSDEGIPNLASKFKSSNISPFWFKNYQKVAKSIILPTFGSFLFKGGQVLVYLNFEARHGILSSFSISQDPICFYFHILIFCIPFFPLTTNAGRGPIFLENVNCDEFIVISVKKCIRQGCETVHFQCIFPHCRHC